MPDASARLLRLLTMLGIRQDWTGAALAERLGITVRTLRRDVRRLRDLGYPVHAFPGVAGGYRLGAGAVLPPLLLDDDEAVAVAIGLRTAASQAVTGFDEAALRTLAKLEQVLPARLRERIAAVALATVTLPSQTPTVDPEALATIAAACHGSTRLAFGYTDRAGAASSRRVEPHRLVHTAYRWYLVARDIDRDDWRTFRVDRLTAPRAVGGRFVPRDPPDAASFVAAAITTEPYRFRARVLIRAPVAVIAEKLPPTVGVLEAADDSSCLLTTGANSLDALIFHLGMLDADLTILTPPELVERAQTLAARLHRSAPPNSPAPIHDARPATTPKP